MVKAIVHASGKGVISTNADETKQGTNTVTFSHYPLLFGQMGEEIQIRTNIYNSRLLIQPNEPQIRMYLSSQLLGRGYFHRSSLLKRKTLALSD